MKMLGGIIIERRDKEEEQDEEVEVEEEKLKEDFLMINNK
jgi:hypothetical protein